MTGNAPTPISPPVPRKWIVWGGGTTCAVPAMQYLLLFLFVPRSNRKRPARNYKQCSQACAKLLTLKLLKHFLNASHPSHLLSFGWWHVCKARKNMTIWKLIMHLTCTYNGIFVSWPWLSSIVSSHQPAFTFVDTLQGLYFIIRAPFSPPVSNMHTKITTVRSDTSVKEKNASIDTQRKHAEPPGRWGTAYFVAKRKITKVVQPLGI